MNLSSERIAGYRKRATPFSTRSKMPRKTPRKTSKTSKTAPRTIISPAVGSLFDIMHDNVGLSLFVPPLFWTDNHTRLLGCRFERVPLGATRKSLSQPPPHPLQSSSVSSPLLTFWPQHALEAMARSIDIVMSPDRYHSTKNLAMGNLMRQLYPDKLSGPIEAQQLHMEFGNRRYLNAVGYQLVWDRKFPNFFPFSSTGPQIVNQQGGWYPRSPILAYMSLSNLDNLRRIRFGTPLGPRGTLNIPVHRYNGLRVRQLLAKNPSEDAYFVGLIIAMAQLRSKGSKIFGQGIRVNVISIVEGDRSFIVYSALVPAAFLAKFHDPFSVPAGNSELVVEYTEVPAWPLQGLKERLSNALGAEFQDNFFAAPRNTGVSRIGLVPKPDSQKRKREVLSDVLNASFSETREPDVRRRMSGKAPRLEEKKDSV